MCQRRTLLRPAARYPQQIRTMATIHDKTLAFIATKLNLSESDITPEKNLFNDLGADSLDVVELLVILEREFNVKFSEDDTSKIKTVGDIYAMIDKYTKTNGI